jgi:NADPH2:quinone reductase
MNEAIALLAQQRVSFSPPQIFKLSEVQKTHALLDQGLVSGKLVMHP